MKKVSKIIFTSLTTMIALSTSMVGLTSNAGNENYGNSISIIEDDTLIKSHSTTSYYNYSLYNTYAQYLVNINAPVNSAAIFDLYTHPYNGAVSIYICPYMTTNPAGNYTYAYFFDASGYAPSQSFSINAGTEYYIYIRSSDASSSNCVYGTITLTKTTA